MDTDFSHLAVRFYSDAKENKHKSKKEGRPIFDDVEMVEIKMAGDKGTEFHAPAHDQSAYRDPATNRRYTYAELHRGPYEAFKANEEYIGNGTPLKQLPFISTAKAAELKALNIHTAEVLAGLDGANLQKLGMGGRELKNQAAAYLDKAGSVAGVANLSAENEALKEQLDALQAQMAQMTGVQADAPATPSQSPFADWAPEDIVNWITDAGGEKPHHKCSKETLIAKADELNEKLRKDAA